MNETPMAGSFWIIIIGLTQSGIKKKNEQLVEEKIISTVGKEFIEGRKP
jgi:hypothetical protein